MTSELTAEEVHVSSCTVCVDKLLVSSRDEREENVRQHVYMYCSIVYVCGASIRFSFPFILFGVSEYLFPIVCFRVFIGFILFYSICNG